MKKFILLLFTIFISTCVQSQNLSMLDLEKGIYNIKLGKYFLEYRSRLKYFGEVENTNVYSYQLADQIIYKGIKFDDILLFFDKNEKLVKMALNKICKKSLSDECFNEYTQVLKTCIRDYSNSLERKDYSETDSDTFSTIWNGNEVMLEIFYTTYKNRVTPDDMAVYISLK